ncbi:MBL fold metallo-hydrolase [Rubrivivax albus]|uniref:MBL fold metallo-hydrolase n=2 Tax=Rubrivivax albus TaxID=2499835 RepID=A0A3S2UR14_9BURK|nr:MBL fold metallo-hydrolase [Rubrivivax albus]RVT52440.1 MBL fold metallo-hydrolase [Rubrivivax albus]
MMLRSWLLLGGLFWAVCAAAWAQVPKAEEVVPGVWFVQGVSALGSAANRNFISNAAFVVTNDGVVVIDALGSPPLAQELLAEIRRVTDKPVRQVIVTHYHADHVYGLQTFKAAGAEVIAHARSAEYLQSDTARLRLEASREDLFPWVDETTHLVPPDRRLTGPVTLTLGGLRFEISHAGPAHTPEDIVVWVPEKRVLFVGDLVFRGRIPFVGLADSGAWVQALDRLLAYDAALIVPGHGAVSAQAREDLQLTRDYLLHLRNSMGKAAADLEPFEDAYAHTDWSRFEHLPLFRAANRINAYNTYLLMERQGR